MQRHVLLLLRGRLASASGWPSQVAARRDRGVTQLIMPYWIGSS